MSYHYLDPNGQVEGPVSLTDMRALFNDGLLHRRVHVSKEGGEWKEARYFPELGAKPKVGEVYMPRAPKKESELPDGFGVVALLSFLLPVIGIVGTLAYALKGKSGAALTILLLALVSSVLWVVLGHALATRL
jgi:hypothetical protein